MLLLCTEQREGGVGTLGLFPWEGGSPTWISLAGLSGMLVSRQRKHCAVGFLGSVRDLSWPLRAGCAGSPASSLGCVVI